MSEKERKFKSFDECKEAIENYIKDRYEDSSVLLLKDVLEYMKAGVTFTTERGVEAYEIVDALKAHGFDCDDIKEILKGTRRL